MTLSTPEDLALDEGMARTLLNASNARSGSANLNLLGRIAFLTERSKGFTEHEWTNLSLEDLTGNTGEYEGQTVRVPNQSYDAEKLMLVVTEIAEAMEAIRDGDEEAERKEIADAIIRLIGYAYRKNFNVGDDVVAKMTFNLDRPFKHGRKR